MIKLSLKIIIKEIDKSFITMKLPIKKKSLFAIIVLSGVVLTSFSQIPSPKEDKPLYKNSKASVTERVKDLLKRMTLEEKVYQMCAARLGEGDEVFKTSGVYTLESIRKIMGAHGMGHMSCPTSDMNAAGAVKTANEIQKVAVEETRLGIPTLINDESLHGIKGKGATSYPQSIALSCTWDLKLMDEIGNAIGNEAYSRGIRQALSPVLDLARDPRHGRIEETYGEDPFLASRFGVAYIKAIQKNGVICSPKHFLANFVTDGGRDAGNVSISERELREIHMVPYKAAVMEAGALSLMAAYNAIDGVPCSANRWLLTDVLCKEWGFKGFVVSDWSGINHTFGQHKITSSLAESAMVCAEAGMDVDLPRVKSYFNLIQMVKEGKIKESSIDENVTHILRVKFEMGLFENPYIDENNAPKLENALQYRQLALKAARESIVLLKNKNNILPLTAKNIAVIGPNADKLQLGGYSAKGVTGPTPLQGIKNIFGVNANISYAKGCDLTGDNKSGFDAAVNIAKQADACVLVMGGQYGLTGGETQDRIDLNLMGMQEDLIKEVSALGKPVVVVLNDGRPATMMNWIDKVDGVVMMYFAGEEGANALGEILAGKVNPSGKISVTVPRHTGQLPMPRLHRPYGREGAIAEYPELMKGDPFNTKADSRYYPLFPFGYGLSYTTYKYDNIKSEKPQINKGESQTITVDVENTGKMDGEEVVQLYLSQDVCRISRPIKQLIAFKRVVLKAGEKQTVTFTVTPQDMSFLNEKLQPEIQAGEFKIVAGKNSEEGVVTKFTVK
jgi:beta-glucosidase